MALQRPLKLIVGSPNKVQRMDETTDTLDPRFGALGVASAFAGTTDVQTLTGKTLTTPKIDSIKTTDGDGALQIQTNVGAVNFIGIRPQLSTGPPVISSLGADTNIDITLASKGTGVPRIKRGAAAAADIVDVSTAQTLSSKILLVPTIADHTNANHTHQSAAQGGVLDAAAIASGTVASARLPAVDALDYTQTGTGFYYYVGLQTSVGVLGAFGPTLKVFYCFPFFAPRRATPIVDQIALEVSTAVAASHAKLAIYNNVSSVSLRPSTLLLDCGNVSCAVGAVVAATVTANLVSGSLYWLAYITDTAGIGLRSETHGASMLSVLGATGTFGATVQSNVGMSLAAYDGGNEYTNFPPANAPAVVAATLNTLGSIPLIGLRYST